MTNQINFPCTVTLDLTALAAAVAPFLAPSVPAPVLPPVLPTQPLAADNVYVNGVYGWPENFNYGQGLIVNTTFYVDPDDHLPSIQVLMTQGQGGIQPGYQNPPGSATVYDTTGRTHLSLTIKARQPGTGYVSGFMGAGDTVIPGSNEVLLANYGTFVIGQYVTFSIPLGAGGYNLPPGAKILKYMIQKNGAAVGDEYDIRDMHFF
jgi:hypothetical protein